MNNIMIDYIAISYIDLFNRDFLIFYAFYKFVYGDIAWNLILNSNFVAFITEW